MRTTMQDVPLAVRRLLDHGASVHGSAEVVTALPESYSAVTYADTARNAARLRGPIT